MTTIFIFLFFVISQTVVADTGRISLFVNEDREIVDQLFGLPFQHITGDKA